MAKLKGRAQTSRRALGTVALVWNLWRRLPPKQRRQIAGMARKHGPRLVKGAYRARRKTRRFSR
jgi:hypothetical protein